MPSTSSPFLEIFREPYTTHELAKSNDLCQRCRDLQLESILDAPDQHKLGHVATIEFSSLQKSLFNGCNLCATFLALFQDYWNLSLSETRSLALDISHVRANYEVFYLRVAVSINHNHQGQGQVRYLFPESNNDSQNSRLVYGRKIEPRRIDFNIPKEWINHCRTYHRTCIGRRKHPVFGFRVIDCHTRRITTIPHDTPFVALSYLWGKTLEEEHRCHEMIPDPAPQTVEDSMLVTVALGIQYLWIDRYCINQSNAEERHHLIQNMNKIYLGAEVTIIAAIGADPHYGLPGVSKTARRAQHVVKIGRHTLVSTCNPRHTVESSLWFMRGWTYQEMVLSPRRLVFTDSQIYFQCTMMYCLEALHLHSSGPSLRKIEDRLPKMRAFPRGANNAGFNALYNRLSEYYRRQLSFETDILNAFGGVFAAFTDVQHPSHGRLVHHFWGIPFFVDRRLSKHPENASFAEALAWIIKQTSAGVCPKKRTGKWPSWTWASLNGGKLSRRFRTNIFRGQNDISVVLTHECGNNVNIATYGSQRLDYTHFLPAIDITSWVIADVAISNNPDMWDVEGISGFPSCAGSIRLDFPYSFTERVTAIYLGSFESKKCTKDRERTNLPFWINWEMVFLLVVEDKEARGYRRVGLWTDVTIPSWVSDLGIYPTSDSSPPWLQVVTFGEMKHEWELQTLRVV